MRTKRSDEGYLLIDHRFSPGVSDNALTQKSGLPTGFGSGLFEAATYTCNHCSRIVVINGKRSRDRGYCKHCDSYICDACGVIQSATMECKPLDQLADEGLEAELKQSASGNQILLP